MVKCNSLLCLFLVGLFVACAIPISAAAPTNNDINITVNSGSLFEIEEPALPQDTDNEFYTYRPVFDPNYFEAYLGENGTAFNAVKTITSREIKRNFPEVKQKLWKQAFWSPSYFLTTTGQTTLDILMKYVESQGEK